jgi:hypothetical protein
LQSVAAPGSPQVIPKPLSRSQTAAAKPMRSTAAWRAVNQAGLVGRGSPSVLWLGCATPYSPIRTSPGFTWFAHAQLCTLANCAIK